MQSELRGELGLLDWADGADDPLAFEHSAHGAGDVFQGDSVVAGQLVGYGANAAAHGDVVRESAHAAGGVFETEHERTGQVALGDIELMLGDAVGGELCEFGADEAHDFVDMRWARAGVHRHGTGIGIGGDARVHRVRETALLANLFEQTTRRSPTENLGGNVQCFTIGRDTPRPNGPARFCGE
jgi:hypothetical protein